MFNVNRIPMIILYLRMIGLLGYFFMMEIIKPAIEHKRQPSQTIRGGYLNLAGGIP